MFIASQRLLMIATLQQYQARQLKAAHTTHTAQVFSGNNYQMMEHTSVPRRPCHPFLSCNLNIQLTETIE